MLLRLQTLRSRPKSPAKSLSGLQFLIIMNIVIRYLDSVGPPVIPFVLAVSSFFLNVRKCSLSGARGRYDSDELHQDARPFVSLLMMTFAMIQFGTSLALAIAAYLMLEETLDVFIYAMWGSAWV
jgi:hypothetical protein